MHVRSHVFASCRLDGDPVFRSSRSVLLQRKGIRVSNSYRTQSIYNSIICHRCKERCFILQTSY